MGGLWNSFKTLWTKTVRFTIFNNWQKKEDANRWHNIFCSCIKFIIKIKSICHYFYLKKWDLPMKKCFFSFCGLFVLFLMYQSSMAISLLLLLLDGENKMEKVAWLHVWTQVWIYSSAKVLSCLRRYLHNCLFMLISFVTMYCTLAACSHL